MTCVPTIARVFSFLRRVFSFVHTSSLSEVVLCFLTHIVGAGMCLGLLGWVTHPLCPLCIKIWDLSRQFVSNCPRGKVRTLSLRVIVPQIRCVVHRRSNSADTALRSNNLNVSAGTRSSKQRSEKLWCNIQVYFQYAAHRAARKYGCCWCQWADTCLPKSL